MQQRVEEPEEAQEVLSLQPLELIQRAEINQQIATAKAYPRVLSLVKKRMLSFATLDEETAESCFYTLSREGKAIQGPSVRLAEIAVACYGNLRAACRVIDNDGKTITAQGVCHDLENNTLISVEVKRRITNKQGRTYSEDMQVVTGNAANAIAFRNAVFKVVPGALVNPVLDAAIRVAAGNASTLATKRAKIISRLNSMQVTTERILLKLGKTSVDDIGLGDLETLIGLGTAIRDGDTTVDQAFAIGEAKPLNGTIKPEDFTPAADKNRGHDGAMPQFKMSDVATADDRPNLQAKALEQAKRPEGVGVDTRGRERADAEFDQRAAAKDLEWE